MQKKDFPTDTTFDPCQFLLDSTFKSAYWRGCDCTYICVGMYM
jgi:hypothetical protein